MCRQTLSWMMQEEDRSQRNVIFFEEKVQSLPEAPVATALPSTLAPVSLSFKGLKASDPSEKRGVINFSAKPALGAAGSWHSLTA